MIYIWVYKYTYKYTYMFCAISLNFPSTYGWITKGIQLLLQANDETEFYDFIE